MHARVAASYGCATPGVAVIRAIECSIKFVLFGIRFKSQIVSKKIGEQKMYQIVLNPLIFEKCHFREIGTATAAITKSTQPTYVACDAVLDPDAARIPNRGVAPLPSG